MQFLQWLRNHLIVVPSSRYRCSSSWRSVESVLRTYCRVVAWLSWFLVSHQAYTFPHERCRNCWLLKKSSLKVTWSFSKMRHLITSTELAFGLFDSPRIQIQNEILEVLVGFWTSTIWRPPNSRKEFPTGFLLKLPHFTGKFSEEITLLQIGKYVSKLACGTSSMTNHLIWLRMLSHQKMPSYSRNVPSLSPISPCSNAFETSKTKAVGWAVDCSTAFNGHLSCLFLWEFKGLTSPHSRLPQMIKALIFPHPNFSAQVGGLDDPVRPGNLMGGEMGSRHISKGLYQQLTVSPSSSRRSSQICWSASKAWQLLRLSR